jgi:hypothetical protein
VLADPKIDLFVVFGAPFQIGDGESGANLEKYFSSFLALFALRGHSNC